MFTNEQEKEHSHTNADNLVDGNKNSHLTKIEKLKGTPFSTVEQEGECLLVLGQYVVLRDENKAAIKKRLEEEIWEVVLRVAIIVNHIEGEKAPDMN